MNYESLPFLYDIVRTEDDGSVSEVGMCGGRTRAHAFLHARILFAKQVKARKKITLRRLGSMEKKALTL